MMPLSKNKIKYIRSLEMKKVRRADRVFMAEGPKLVGDLLGRFHCRLLAATSSWLNEHSVFAADECFEVDQEELSRISMLKTPQQVLAVFDLPVHELRPEYVEEGLCLALDDVQDPGNLGTIVRLADWFGIEHIICSPGTADVYSPKAIQATMGGIARVQVHYTPLADFICSLDAHVPVFGTFLNGENLYERSLPGNGLLVMGNEGNGIGEEIEKLVSHRLYVPNYPMGKATSESLNVAVATAIVCAEFRRQASWK